MFIAKKNKPISKSDWELIVDSNKNLLSIHEQENLDIKVYNYATLVVEGKGYGRLIWDWERERIKVDVKQKFLLNAHSAILDVANALGAIFFIKKTEPFNANFHLPIPKVRISRKKAYFKDFLLDDIRWLAFKEDYCDNLIKHLRLQVKRRNSIEKLLTERNDNELILTPSFQGWSFLIGDDLPHLFLSGKKKSSLETINELCSSLEEVSKIGKEIQYYEHSSISGVDGFFKAVSGKLIYGYWESEIEVHKKGRIPKVLKKADNLKAHDVAAIWSIDPKDFIYIESFKEKKSDLLFLNAS